MEVAEGVSARVLRRVEATGEFPESFGVAGHAGVVQLGDVALSDGLGGLVLEDLEKPQPVVGTIVRFPQQHRHLHLAAGVRHRRHRRDRRRDRHHLQRLEEVARQLLRLVEEREQ